MLHRHDIKTPEKFLAYLKDLKEKPAIIYHAHSISYQQLFEYAYRLSAWLMKKAKHQVMFATENSPLNICLYLAGWLAKKTIFAVNPRLTANELLQIIVKQNIDTLFVEKSQFTDQLRQHCLQYDISWHIVDDPIIFLSTLPDDATSSIQQNQQQALTYHISSGTGGHYNLHAHTTKQILDYAYKRQFDLGLQYDDNILIALSINHAYAFSYQLLPALSLGLTLHLMPKFNAKAVAKAVIHYKITALALLPTMYHFLLQAITTHYPEKYPHCLRYLSVAGDQPNKTLMDSVYNILNLKLLNGMGMTEVFGYAQNMTASDQYNKIKLFDDVKVKIQPLPNQKQIGEIYLQSPMHPVNNHDKWLQTGDFGYVDKHHFLYFLGRIKDIIIKGGSNIAPLEVEHYLYRLTKINEVAVLGKKDPIWGEIICACIAIPQNATLTLTQVNKHLTNYLATYKHIDQIYFFDTLPKNVTGKIDRYQLRRVINA
ncbi:class I adenylate-forming enzyme family protein [Facilibium subflavum]|uniref:class I adenylate-forming enzyme family protein n=1 Tax=Facilibium subflavum TaxID=2219058 RepID=UPI000E658214|nr:class I adenylate-forming enzyme family protein [Facilibium subflavum]